ncbi:MAG: ATP-dependent metallopeptidase FtsH/Yme1/Tma family protein [Deferribacteres bacterium]|nr:ATP-dependent zinc metalloprotease FtsH [candidate division KSB1 bacterium]MCB9503921.1 ATP-dependent metallopeptidase FtsH/Yme1/Tma family protein [Deferribacteres bacterium]
MKSQNNNPNSPHKKKNEDNFQWSKATRTLAFWLFIFIISIWLTMQLGQGESPRKKINYSEFLTLLEKKEISRCTIEGMELTGELKEPRDFQNDGRQYTHIMVMLSEEIPIETANKWIADYSIELEFKERALDWGSYMLNLLPWILLAGFWIFFLRRMQGGGGGARGIFNFGRSRAKLMSESVQKVTFKDVAGADEAKTELVEIIEFLREPEKFQRLGGRIPKGALLLGPPGTGKTLLAKAVAGEAGVPFFSMSGADFVEMFVGVGASRVRDLFEQGKKNAPCIIFIDEIDAVGRSRGAGLGGGHDEREQTLNQLLVEMDGFESNEGVILIAATNRPDVLDSALLRPGRFDRQIVVDLPDVRGREGILKVHSRAISVSRDVDLKVIAKGTPGFSGADLANMVNEAALLAARRNKRIVDMNDFEDAKDKVLMGTERKSLILSDKEKKLTAYHEAGHALVAKFTKDADPVHKVTIIPRGRALGVTTYLPIDERHSYPKSYCENWLVHLLGGRNAELLIFEEVTNGAGNDLERATEMARKMVCEWGMSEVVGPLVYGKKEEEVFLGREFGRSRNYSEETAQLLDVEIKKIITWADERSRTILKENIDKLHAIAEALLKHETIDGDDIEKIVNGEELIKENKNGTSEPAQNDEKPAEESRENPTDN